MVGSTTIVLGDGNNRVAAGHGIGSVRIYADGSVTVTFGSFAIMLAGAGLNLPHFSAKGATTRGI